MNKLLLILMLIFPAYSQGKTIKMDPKRTVVISGQVKAGIVLLADQLIQLSLEKKKTPINVLIESPGGSVFTGYFFLNAMKAVQAKGIKIRCLVPSFAASMAYIIFAYCDERYAFSRSLLLFHPMSIGFMGSINVPRAESIKKQFQILSKDLDKELMTKMGMKIDVYNHFNNKEYFWTASELKRITVDNFITIISGVDGPRHLFGLSSIYGATATKKVKKNKSKHKTKQDATCKKCHKKPHKRKSKNIFPEFPGIKIDDYNNQPK